MNNHQQINALKRNTRRWILFFMVSLITSGATAFDVQRGLQFLHDQIHTTPLADWITVVYHATTEVTAKYPFLFYGYDWLAFAHIVIAIAFIGPYKDPVKNEWVIQFGMIACALVLPAAFIMGTMRHITTWWLLIDCSFGVLGFIPLYITWGNIKRLKKLGAAGLVSVQSGSISQIVHRNKLFV